MAPDCWPRVVALWEEGYNMAQISRQFGVEITRERIRQLKHLLPPRRWVSIASLRRLASNDVIKRWVDEGYVARSPGRLVDRVQVEARFRALVERQCEYPGCDEAIGSISERGRFCAEHTVEVQLYRYPVMTPTERAQHYVATKRWQKANPKKAAAIQERARAAYLARSRGMTG